MKKLSKKESGFSAIEALLIIVIVAALAFVGWYVWLVKNNTNKVYNNAGNASNTVAPPVSAKPPDDLAIKVWNVKIPLTKDINDAYYTYDSKDQTVSISTHQLDALIKTGKAGCIGRLDPLQRLQANDPQLQTLSNKEVVINVKIGDYYILTKPESHPLCAVRLNSTTNKINSLDDSLTTQIKLLQPN